MKNRKLLLLLLSISFSIKAQTAQQTLTGDQPLSFISMGSGLYNKSVIYHNTIHGFKIDLAKTQDDVNATPIDFNINARGGLNSFFTILGANGNTGVGTENPTDKLHVKGTARVGNGDWGALIIDGKDENDWLFNAHNGGTLLGIRTQQDGQAPWSYQIMTLNRLSGNVGIGTTTPDAKLTVKGNIHAEEVKVDLSVPGPDYVFKEDYDLKSLEEVQNYIQEHGHLPNIPSAQEMEKNGIQLGEMNMKLLEKIEELILYALEQEKEILEQRKLLKNKNRKITEIENRLQKIEQLLSQNQ